MVIKMVTSQILAACSFSTDRTIRLWTLIIILALPYSSVEIPVIVYLTKCLLNTVMTSQKVLGVSLLLNFLKMPQC